MPWQPGKSEAAADEGRGGGETADGPALLGAEPADIPWLLAAGVTDNHLHLGFQVLEAQFAVQTMQGMFRMGDGNELDIAQFCAEVTGNAEPGDGQVSHAFKQDFLHARQHFFAQAYPAATALRHERRQCADEASAGVSRIDDQTYFGFPTLLHMVGEVFQLAGLFHQLSRAAQQNAAGLGEHCFTPVDAQQRHTELVLHAGDGVAHRRLRTVQSLGGLGESAVVDHGLQCSPLIKGHAGRFHQ